MNLLGDERKTKNSGAFDRFGSIKSKSSKIYGKLFRAWACEKYVTYFFLYLFCWKIFRCLKYLESYNRHAVQNLADLQVQGSVIFLSDLNPKLNVSAGSSETSKCKIS
jgi:hypothetical protein